MASQEDATIRLTIANLHAETEWAGGGTLPHRVLQTAAAAGTLLRALQLVSHEPLLLPVPIDPQRLAPVTGLPMPCLITERQGSAGFSQLIAWAETPAVRKLRFHSGWRGPKTPQIPRSAYPTTTSAPNEILSLLWPKDKIATATVSTPDVSTANVTTPEAAAAVNHRRFALELTKRLGCALPGAKIIRSPDELRQHLQCPQALTGWEGRWVLKAGLSAAGRDRYFGQGADPGTETSRGKIFRRRGGLLFEPWMQRLEDFGALGWVTQDSCHFLGQHRLMVDPYGRFRGVELQVGQRDLPDCSPAIQQRLEEIVHRVAPALRQQGYLGPFSIDAWSYQTHQGQQVLNPLGEINARLTFGFVARVLVDRVASPLGFQAGSLVQLHFGPRPTNAISIPLLHPTEQHSFGAWLTPKEERRPTEPSSG